MATKGYPRSRFEIIDQTANREIAVTAINEPIPLAMAAFTSDKGPENWRVITSFDELTSNYGAISYARHGQPQLTVAEVLRAGGVVLGKRIVANDATLANVTIYARVVKVSDVSYVYYYAKSETNAKTFRDAYKNHEYMESADFINGVSSSESNGSVVEFPLFTITAIGRGASNISFTILPIYNASKISPEYICYRVQLYENQEPIDKENITITLNPNISINGVSYAMNPKINIASSQVRVKHYENAIKTFVTTLKATAKTSTVVADAKDMSIMDIINSDIINGKDRTGTITLGGVVTKTGVKTTTDSETGTVTDNWTSNLPSDIKNSIVNFESGINLLNGTYGALTESPMNNADTIYADLLLNVFGKKTVNTSIQDIDINSDILSDFPQFDTVIYDLDRYKVDFICDCGYNFNVKNAIVDLVEYRGDMVFLADLGIGVTNISEIINSANRIKKSKFVSIYHNSFDIYNPYSSKQITVTMPLLLAPKMVTHIANGAGRPFAGMLNDITFPDIIEESINFTPRELPVVNPNSGAIYNQKQALVDANVNYLNYYDGLATMDTMYVNVDAYTQMSYLSNIMGIQAIIKEIRTKCPRTRYTFMDGTDLEEYIDDATAIISEYNSLFKSISIKYMADEYYESNNIFYAVLNVQFRNFIQEEYFRIIAIS